MKSNKMIDDAFLILVVKKSLFVCFPIDCFVFVQISFCIYPEAPQRSAWSYFLHHQTSQVQTGPVRTDMVALILPPSRTWTLFIYITWSMVSIGDNLSNRTSRCFFNGRLLFILCQIWIFIQSPIFFDTINLFDHHVFLFLHRPIFWIKTAIICRWWLTNCRLSISNIIWVQICRKRQHIWIMKPRCTRIKHIEISTPWDVHRGSIWRKTVSM